MTKLVWTDDSASNTYFLGTNCFTISISLISLPRRKKQYQACIRTHPYIKQNSETDYFIYSSVEEAKEKSLEYIRDKFTYEADLAEKTVSMLRELVKSI